MPYIHIFKVQIFCIVLMLCFNGVVIAKGDFEPMDKIAGIGNEIILPTSQTQILAKKITGLVLLWTRPTIETYSGIQLEALKDYDLKSKLPQNGSELTKMILSRANKQSLPLLLNSSDYFSGADFHGHQMFLSSLKETSHGLMAELVFSVLTPEDQVLNFTRSNVLVTGKSNELCNMQLSLEGDESTNDPEFPITIKGSMDLDSASYVSFTCDGFESFQLICEYRFPNSLLTPVQVGRNNVRAMFKISSTELGQFIGTVSIDPFEVVGLDDVRFEIQEAVVDYSTGSNFAGMEEIIDPQWPADLRGKYLNDTWRGFYMKRLSVSLPEGLSTTSGQRINIAIEDLLADHGSGVTGKVMASPALSGNVSGWGLSLDQLLLEVLANSVHEFKLEGKINIPIMEGTSGYEAMFNYPPGNPNGKAEISFNLTLDGTYKMPFLANSSLTLDNGSVAGISYTQGKFQPHATLHGKIELGLSNPKVTLPAMEFQDFKINDFSLPSYGDVAGKVTGGLDKISVGAFGFGGLALPGGSGSTGYLDTNDDWYLGNKLASGPNNSGLSLNNQNNTPGNDPIPNQKLAGFPITIRNIGLGKGQDGENSCYKLNFTIGVNFAKGVNAFNAEGSFSVWAGLDFNKILSSKPWDAVSYRKTTVESILIEADLGKVSITGGIRLINDDPVYGSGFKGAIAMSVKLPSAGFIVQSVGQFGNIPATNGVEDYRYFFVDAEVGFSSGLQLGNTGLAIYGFSGGLFYNMNRLGMDPATVAANKNVASMPPNAIPNMTGQLLEPGITLSGTQYVPKLNKTSFQVGMIFGLSAPQTMLADVAFGMDINTSNGFAIEKVYFNGGAYLMNKGLAERKKAASVLQLKLQLDLLNDELVGNFGFAFSVPTGVPANLALITGLYNTNLAAVNVYFKFKGQKEYFFYAGTPTEPMKINFQLTESIKLGNINAYFMVGTKMPVIPTLVEVFDQEGYDLPNELRNIAGRSFISGDRGVAFGARLSIPKKTYKFLMFSSSIQAMAGFDASMMYVDQNVSCGSNGTFGMNNWYMQGQAYGAFKGSLSMRINLLFYSGTVKIAELEAGAALQAKLPNPTWMMGFIYGRYSVLGGRIKGRFSFKLEMGEQCSELPEYDPLANIPLIMDVSPVDKSNTEIYNSPSATFFIPMGQTLNIPITDNNGKVTTKFYQCFVNDTYSKINKKGSSVAIPIIINYQDTFSTAVFQPKSMLEPNTDYEFTIRVGWKEIKGAQIIASATFEERKISFRTGDKPIKIISEAIGYQAPGFRQRYWHKNYARPLLEFKQHGWDYLFPTVRPVSFKTKDVNIALAFSDAGWNTVKVGDSTKISRDIPLKYVCRLKNTKTNSVVDLDINEYPVNNQDGGFELVIDFFYINGFPIPIIKLVPKNLSGKLVRFDDLNNLMLTKGQIYSIEIIQTADGAVPMPVTTTAVENTESVMYNDTLEVFTKETVTLQVTPLNQYNQALQQMIGDVVLYNDYHFGVSKYEHIRYKYYDITHASDMQGGFRNDFGYPDAQLPQVKFSYPTFDEYYGFNNPLEPFDKFDQIVLRNNLQLRTDGVYGNPVRDYMLNQRKPIEMLDLVGDRANNYVKAMRAVLAKNDSKAQILRDELSVPELFLQSFIIPYDLYYPRNSDNKTYSDQTGVLLRDNGSLAAWYKFKNKRLNDEENSNRLSFQQYKDFTKKVLGNYLNVPGWANQFHFNTSFSSTITDSEITTKTMKTWGPGNYPANYSLPGSSYAPGSTVMWIQNSEGRILQNMLQMYVNHAIYLDQLTYALIISKEQLNTYRLMRNYYIDEANHSFYKKLLDVYSNNRLAALKTKQLGWKLRFTNNQAQEYIHSAGAQDGNTRGTGINVDSYDVIMRFFGY
ncbi:hypothetical protein [Candidatus Brachybacter algidus]|uniref:Ig-like domain-containing protein n=1 Tax=Candidatus Brachybacter algidus TaxID=2982024 RepID=UPI001D436C34|nr:hypothetical protein [Candidatus Brachybacter algidus]MBK6449727.1 hypothetical protein [Candidatus Brachybacter algidus]